MTESDFREIRSTIDYMRLLDTKFQVSGSETHKYQFAGPMPEETVLALEKANGIRLPEDYRLFMTRLGPGAGPNPGVYGPKERKGTNLSLPFPFEQTMTYAGNSGLQAWEDALSAFPGMLTIGYPGGTVMTELVVGGKASGIVWLTEERGYFPLNQTFGEWYLEWLHWLKDTAAPALIQDQIMDQVHHEMTRAEVLELCGVTGGEWREKNIWEKTYDLEFVNLLTTFRMTKDNLVQDTIVHSLYHRSAADDEKRFATVTNTR